MSSFIIYKVLGRRKNIKNIKNMSFKELDDLIDKLPRTYMKAIKYQSILKERPDYIPKHIRNNKKEGIK